MIIWSVPSLQIDFVGIDHCETNFTTRQIWLNAIFIKKNKKATQNFTALKKSVDL